MSPTIKSITPMHKKKFLEGISIAQELLEKSEKHTSYRLELMDDIFCSLQELSKSLKLTPLWIRLKYARRKMTELTSESWSLKQELKSVTTSMLAWLETLPIKRTERIVQGKNEVEQSRRIDFPKISKASPIINCFSFHSLAMHSPNLFLEQLSIAKDICKPEDFEHVELRHSMLKDISENINQCAQYLQYTTPKLRFLLEKLQNIVGTSRGHFSEHEILPAFSFTLDEIEEYVKMHLI